MGRLRDAIVMLAVACAVPCVGLAAGRAAGPDDQPAGPAMQVFRGPNGMYAIATGPLEIDLPVQKGAAAVKAAPAKEAAQPAATKAAAKVDKAAERRAAQKKAEEDALEAQAAQYVQQIRPMFRAEYYFTKNACNLDHDQRLALARLGEKATKGAARAFVDAQQKMMRGGWRPGMEQPDPHKLIQEEVRKAIPPLLTPDQRARYQQEYDRRVAARKRMFIDNFVAKLDQDLVLTADQRSKIAEGIALNWKDSWGQSIEMIQNIDNFFPDIPDKVVSPHLTENQRSVWRRIPRNSGVFWGFSVGLVQGDDPLDDPELAQAEKEARGDKPEEPQGDRVIRGRVIRRVR
ncbi:hypothetical protein OJF2_10710 [Aquisphaera giovannonii]|uniref:LTXXQ motif protein n=1 Tax=Aquisphaera giovannonii TaxID=406548 RepID=A0A5B9VWI3_9BACT|nr:hypothetical protein [Aquisphaera giovannonii]QEH32592.1 hypothetical protein OJF2_10710 [Aquisphaera giovannonii]